MKRWVVAVDISYHHVNLRVVSLGSQAYYLIEVWNASEQIAQTDQSATTNHRARDSLESIKFTDLNDTNTTANAHQNRWLFVPMFDELSFRRSGISRTSHRISWILCVSEYELHSVDKWRHFIILRDLYATTSKETLKLRLKLVRPPSCCMNRSIVINQFVFIDKREKFCDFCRFKRLEEYVITIRKLYYTKINSRFDLLCLVQLVIRWSLSLSCLIGSFFGK